MESATAPATPSFGLSTIGQVAITVTDVERAVAFYRDRLGVRLLFQVPNMAFFDCGGVRLMISGSERNETFSSVIYFKVANIEEAHRTMLARDVPFEGAPHRIARMSDHDLWMAFFRDPDRNSLALMSEVPLPAE